MDKLLKNTALSLILSFLSLGAWAQQPVEVEGYFLQDSAKLGERVAYVLKAKYGKGQNIIFPDSTFDFSPFVLLEKKTFISSSNEEYTLDSAIYFVSNFSLDPLVDFSIPVFEVFKYDSLIYKPLESSLALKLTIDQIPDELAFRDNNVYQPIETSFNYPLMIALILVLALVGLVVFFFFGKQISRKWEIWLEKRKYKRFEQRWQKAEASFTEEPSMEHADELLGLWKTYMEHLKVRPFREWTTTEISNFLENKEVIKDFREIEMIIYAGKSGKDLPQACQNLWNICSQSYQQKITPTDERQ